MSKADFRKVFEIFCQKTVELRKFLNSGVGRLDDLTTRDKITVNLKYIAFLDDCQNAI